MKPRLVKHKEENLSAAINTYIVSAKLSLWLLFIRYVMSAWVLLAPGNSAQSNVLHSGKYYVWNTLAYLDTVTESLATKAQLFKSQWQNR